MITGPGTLKYRIALHKINWKEGMCEDSTPELVLILNKFVNRLFIDKYIYALNE